jgi:integrase
MASRRHFGSVRKRASGRHEASYWYRGSRHTAPTTFATKADAQSWLSTVEADVQRGGWVDPRAGRITFAEYSEGWMGSRPDLRPRSRIAYQSLLKVHLNPAFGSKAIGDITSSEVRTWYARLKATRPGTVTSAYRLLRAVLNTAVDDELLLKSPCRVKNGGTDQAKERPMLTLVQVKALLEAMPDRLRLAVTLAAWGGLRRGEALGLRRRDVDQLRSSVHVEQQLVELSDGSIVFAEPKSEAGVRTVYLPQHAMREIQEHLDQYVAANPDALLLTGRGGVPMRPKTLYSGFGKARTACGLAHIHFHDLRHFSLTMAATSGATTKELMRRGGQSSPAAALRYQHATEDRDKAIAEALEAMVTGTVTPISQAKKKRASRP